MNILIVNDDGIDSEGISLLAQTLSEKHNVFTVAPDRNRSAVSNGATMFSPMKIKKIKEAVWTCSGLPADCTSVGLTSGLLKDKLKGEKIDAVLSGINYGANLGTDIIFSGTCGGAREAVLYGVPGIALSIDPLDWEKVKETGFKFKPMCDFVNKNLEKLVSLCNVTGEGDKPRTFINVNAPNLDEYRGVKFTSKACTRYYSDTLSLEKTADGDEFESHLVFGVNRTTCKTDGDYDLVQKGFVAVSAVVVDPVYSDSVDGIEFSV